MALGVPVAATGVSGIPELIIHGRTGMLAPLGRKTLFEILVRII
jgi:glycosyltransferase involved in cell wall biosynthesis